MKKQVGLEKFMVEKSQKPKSLSKTKKQASTKPVHQQSSLSTVQANPAKPHSDAEMVPSKVDSNLSPPDT